MKLHVLGACGTFMGGVAQLAVQQGHEVSGSDSALYEPMAGQLRTAGITCRTGYVATLADIPAQEYVIGNALSRGNASLEAVLAAGLPLRSGPAWLAEEVLANTYTVVAVAGTHGKTTTTALVAHVLAACGREPGYLVGGELAGGAPSARLGDGACFVVEADEYDSSFCDKRPKFVHYWADVAVLNNIEFDHSDIYADLDSVKRAFALLPRQLRPGGVLVANGADELVREVAVEQSWHSIVWFNDARSLHWRGDKLHDGAAVVGTAAGLPPGVHNRANVLAALATCCALDVAPADALAALANFALPARRLQVIHQAAGITVIDDFAHHPTALRASLAALREAYPAARLLVAFEPRSNTMRAGHWQGQLAVSLAAADYVFGLAEGLSWNLATEFAPLGAKATACANIAVLQERILAEVRAGDVVALLSNGDFAGLRQALPQALSHE